MKRKLFKSLIWQDKFENSNVAYVEIKVPNFYKIFFAYEIRNTKEDGWVLKILSGNTANFERVASMEDGKRIAEEHYQKVMEKFYLEFNNLRNW